jgi:hypothetical protein
MHLRKLNQRVRQAALAMNMTRLEAQRWGRDFNTNLLVYMRLVGRWALLYYCSGAQS